MQRRLAANSRQSRHCQHGNKCAITYTIYVQNHAVGFNICNCSGKLGDHANLGVSMSILRLSISFTCSANEITPLKASRKCCMQERDMETQSSVYGLTLHV